VYCGAQTSVPAIPSRRYLGLNLTGQTELGGELADPSPGASPGFV
jgi:hypothetical protein